MTSVYSRLQSITRHPHVGFPPNRSKSALLSVVAESGGRNIRRHWMRDALRISVLLTTDMATFFAARTLVRLVQSGTFGSWLGEVSGTLFPMEVIGAISFPVAILMGLTIVGAYGAGDLRRDSERVLGGVALGVLFTMYPLFWAGGGAGVAMAYLATVAVFVVCFTIDRSMVDWAVTRKGPLFGANRAIVVGDTDLAGLPFGPDPTQGQRVSGSPISLQRFRGAPLTVVGSVGVSDDGGRATGPGIDELSEMIHETDADTVVLRRPLDAVEFDSVVDQALACGCRLLAGSRSDRLTMVEPRSVWVSGQRWVELTAPHLAAWQLALKRSIDLVASAIGLVLLSPLLLGIAICVKLDSPGPVLFGHERLGARGRTFRLFKFRSMKRNAEALLRDDPDLHRMYVENGFKVPDGQDPRVTRIGRFLRRTSLDELPQLINVFLGQMSLVGPRPIVLNELGHYGECAPLFLSLRPGITGTWAVNGRSAVGYPKRALMELQYVRGWSIMSDLVLLLRTVPAVLKKRGAH